LKLGEKGVYKVNKNKEKLEGPKGRKNVDEKGGKTNHWGSTHIRGE